MVQVERVTEVSFQESPRPTIDLESEVQVRSDDSFGARLRRAVQVLRNYRWIQIARRGKKVAKNFLLPNRTIGAIPVPAVVALRAVPETVARMAEVAIRACGRSENATRTDLRAGVLTLLHESRNVGIPIRWRTLSANPAIPRLWRFQLHYHEFLAAALVRKESDGAADVWAAVESWLGEYSPESTAVIDDAWHPYCVSRRIPVWCWMLIAGDPPASAKLRMTESLFRQTQFLSENLEYDPGGNHLLENLAALTLAASVLEVPQAKSWLELAGRIWKLERESQLLPHGEHFERSPMYHAHVAGNLLRQSVAAQTINPQLAAL